MAWRLGAVVVFFALTACAANQRGGEVRYVVTYVANNCETGERDEELAVAMTGQRERLERLLPDPPLIAESSSELRAAVAAQDPRPLVVFYAGHATDFRDEAKGKPPEPSALCLDDGTLRVDDLLAEISPAVPSAVFVLDACYTARTELRRSPVPVAVLSAADEPVSTSATGSSLIDFLETALRDGDVNADTILDDRELLAEILGKMGNHPTAEPRLRRQSYAALPVLVRRTGEGGERSAAPTGAVSDPALARVLARELEFTSLRLGALSRTPSVFWALSPESTWVAPSSGSAALVGPPGELTALARRLTASEGFALELRDDDVALHSLRDRSERIRLPAARRAELAARVQAGHWARLSDDRRSLWHGGYVHDRIVTFDGTEIDGSRLRAIPCPDAFGQCFELTEDPRSP